MSVEVKNIYCVGRNYILHAQELNNPIPTSPLIFHKPTHSLAIAQEQDIVLPANKGTIHYELEMVVHIQRKFEPGININEMIDYMALGIDFTLRDVQDEVKQKGLPWELAKGFRNSAVLTPWIPFAGIENVTQHDFALEKNGQEIQRGNLKNVIFDLPTLIAYISEHLGLDKGDIIFTGTPAGVGPAANGDKFVFKWKEQALGAFTVKQ